MSDEINNQQHNPNSVSEELDSSWKILEKPEASWTDLGKSNQSQEVPIKKPVLGTASQATPQENVIGSKKTPTYPIPPISEEKEETPIQPIQNTQGKQPQGIKQQPKKIWQVLKFIGVVIGIFLFIYAFLTFPALLSKATYWWQKNIAKTKPQTQKIIPATVNDDVLFLSTVTNYAPPDKPQTEKLPTKESLGVIGLGNNEIWIAKLDKKAPIVWDSPVDEATMQQNLKYGVVHYNGTTKPDEKAENGAGNVFISGHSSYYWWDEGKYKTIFANLDQMEPGDEIAVGYDNKVYIYKVTEKFEVNPDEVSVLDQNTQKPTLSLMTCVPVGTNLRRLIIKSELVAVGSDVGGQPSTQPQPTSQPTIQPTQATTTTTPISQPTPIKLPDIDSINLLPWRW